jgi:glycosyltransferase involved in cell wall biosynthesis
MSKQPSKIVFIHLLNDFSGSPRVLKNTIDACLANGIKNIELWVGNKAVCEGFLSDIDIPVYYYPYKRTNKFLTLFSFLYSQLVLCCKLFRYRKQPVVFYINTMLPFGAAFSAMLQRKKVIYHIHEYQVRPSFLRPLLEWTNRKSAYLNIFVSAFIKDQYRTSTQSVLVYNGLDSKIELEGSKYEYTPKKNGKFRVGMVCSLRDYKGIPELIKLAQILKNEFDLEFDLVTNGNAQDVEKYIKKYELPDNLVVSAFTKDICAFYQRINLNLNLSRPTECLETFGLTLIEGFAHGVPAIGPPVGGPTEIIDNEINGYLINSVDTDLLASKILQLRNDEDMCMVFSTNARKKARIYTNEKFNTNISNVLNVFLEANSSKL